MIERIEILDEMGLTDKAIDEGYEWSDLPGCPVDVWPVIAQLEAGAGNVQGAIRALDRGLQTTPDRPDWWTEMGELLTHSDDRPGALRAAARGLVAAENVDRCLAVIAEIAERYYGTGVPADALAACSIAGNLQERSAAMCWMRARIAANTQDFEYQLKWVRATVEADPNHADALAMLEKYDRPEKKSSWKLW
jgi:tetratricopeptide (TPR) repeat protein